MFTVLHDRTQGGFGSSVLSQQCKLNNLPHHSSFYDGIHTVWAQDQMRTFRTGEGGEGMQGRHRAPLRGRTSYQALCMPRLTLKELNETAEGCRSPARCTLHRLILFGTCFPSVWALPFWSMCVEPAYIFALFVSSVFTFLHSSHISDSMRAPFHEFGMFWDLESRPQGCFRVLY